LLAPKSHDIGDVPAAYNRSMTFDWQLAVAGVCVLLAALYVAWRIRGLFTPEHEGSCSACERDPNTTGAPKITPLVQLGGPQEDRNMDDRKMAAPK
jgi:hypothetical protein